MNHLDSNDADGPLPMVVSTGRQPADGPPSAAIELTVIPDSTRPRIRGRAGEVTCSSIAILLREKLPYWGG
jgi:hypothetical protein